MIIDNWSKRQWSEQIEKEGERQRADIRVL